MRFVKFVLVFCLLVAFCTSLAGCSAPVEEEFEDTEIVSQASLTSDRFIVAECQDVGIGKIGWYKYAINVVVDSQTGVSYMSTITHTSEGHFVSTTLMVDADGKPLIYDKDLLNGYGGDKE